jgi:hypothetical protein
MNTALVNSTLSNLTLSPKEGEGHLRTGWGRSAWWRNIPTLRPSTDDRRAWNCRSPVHAVFPPPEKVWQVVPAPPVAARPQRRRWTRDEIELEELHKHQEQMSRQGFNQQSFDIQNRIAKRANAEEAKDQEYDAMDESQCRAYHLGILRGLEAAQEQSEEEARKKPAAKAAVGS